MLAYSVVSDPRLHDSRGRARGRVALVAALAIFLGAVTVPPAFASSVTSATFTGGTGTVSVAGTLYAKSGGALTLTVITSSDTRCVDVAGAFSAHAQSATTRTTWTFTTTAGAGDGAQAVTASASPNINPQNKCVGQSTSLQASYILDNTGPVVTAALSPAPNAGGWNRSNVTLDWSANDAGSGVASGPTPATDSVNTNTAGVTKTSTATDRLGNTGNGSVLVKLDTTNPTIGGSWAPAPNAAGWNQSDVTVSFDCADALSGIQSCTGGGSVLLSTEGANQSVSGTAVDNADNSAAAVVTGINIDKTAPILVGSPTAAANGDGWYRGDVTIGWSGTDATSGIDPATQPANGVITGEGTGLTTGASISDIAGNTTLSDSTAVNIDRTAPTTGISGTSNSWVNGSVAVTLSPSDNLSGVASTSYWVDGGAEQTGTWFTLASEGEHTISYSSTDAAGNVEGLQTVQVRIDATAPTIGHSFSLPGYTDGAWTNQDVTVSFTCADTGSGVASCTAPVTTTTEGVAQQVVGTATDNAGNSATDTAVVSIDKTAPTISAVPDRPANAAGWYNDDVTVSFPANDSLSGLVTATTPQVLGEGANQSASGSATDAAGNSAGAELTGINIDKTNPVLSADHPSGWHTGDVTVVWSCTDALSGVAVGPVDETVTGEGDNLSSSATCTDNAGNVASETVNGIQIDRHAPTTTASVPAPLDSGWYAAAVEVTLHGVDALSGVGATRYSVDGGAAQNYLGVFSFDTAGVHSITFWSVDVAGNVENSSANTIALKIDGTPPTTTVINPISPASGWFVVSGIPVAFDASDADSGIAATYYQIDGGEVQTYGEPFDALLATGNHTIAYWSVDLAGNVEPQQTTDVNVDTVRPTITGAATPLPNSAGWNNTDVALTFTCDDIGSGIASCGPDTTLGTEGADQSVSGNSVDNAGNAASTSVDHISIDKTAPSLTGTPTTASNGNGWYRGDVAVEWIGADALSGIDPASQPANGLITGEGSGLTTGASISDIAGNGTTATSAAVNIDRTAPTTGIVGAPNSWFNDNVNITLVPSDNLSGIASTSYSVDGGDLSHGTWFTLSSEGIHAISFFSTDAAGNVESAQTVQVKIDKTAPTIGHSFSLPGYTDGAWTNQDVTVSFTCADTGSGVASCTAPVTTTTEGVAQQVVGTATDNAGNSATDTAVVSIDKTPPTISAVPDRPANAAGWYNDDVTVSFPASDALSGISSSSAAQLLSEGANQSASGTATDAAGNSADAELTGINIDKTNPILTADVPGGWHTGDVTVVWSCTDALSGVGVAPANDIVTGEGDNLSSSATCTDNAGNVASETVNGIQIDRTGPTIDINVNGQVYILGAVPPVTCSAADGLSGPVPGSCTVTVTGGTPNGVGTFAYTGSATDIAGNVGTNTGSYRVIYRWDGFLQPINDTAHQIGTSTSTFKGGSTIPVKFQLKNSAGTVVQANTAPVWLTPSRGVATSGAVNESSYPVMPDSGVTYRHDSSASQYIYNWKTGTGGYYYRIGVTLDDGQTYYVNIALR